MQIALATAMAPSYTVGQYKQGEERQPQQKLEALVADSFTPSTTQTRSGASWKTLAIVLALSPLGLHACSQEAPKVTSATETATAKAVAKATPALETSLGQLERTVEQKIQERSGLSQSTFNDYQGAIAQSNGITGVRSSVSPSVAPQALQPIPPTTHTLLSAEHFIDSSKFSPTGIAFSTNGKALLGKYFSCEGPSGKELHFKVQYQYPDGRYANGDVNMSSFQDCPQQILAIAEQMKQGGFKTLPYFFNPPAGRRRLNWRATETT